MPSYFMAYQNCLEVVKLLLADPRVDTNKFAGGLLGNLNIVSGPITAAAVVGNLEVVQLLLRCPKVILGFEGFSGPELYFAKHKTIEVPDELRLRIVEAIESRQTLLEQGHTC